MKREKPSERLQFALDALIEAEKPDAPVKPYMSWWHHVDHENKCFACLGGLAAIKKYSLDPRKGYGEDEEVRGSGKARLSTVERYEISLNYFREGNINDAFEAMGYSYDAGGEFNRQMADYHRNKEQFKEDTRQLIKDLQTAGY